MKSENPKDGTLTTIPKAPVLAGDRGLKFDSLDSMWRFCTAVVNSGTFKDINTPEIALIRLQAGLELGLTPIWSLTNIMVVNGRPSVWGDALPGILKARSDCDDIIEIDPGELSKEGENAVARCEVLRRGKQPVIRTYSVKDAKRAGLWGKTGPWTTNPYRQLQMRARAFACRDSFPDALRGLGVVEELRDIEPRTPAPERIKAAIVLPDEVERQNQDIAKCEAEQEELLV